MLRITVQPEQDRIRLKLEGDLAGIWVAEVEESWREASSACDDRPLYLDLTDVVRVDRAGRYLLGLLRCSGAHLVASGIRMTELVRCIESRWPPAGTAIAARARRQRAIPEQRVDA
jgi:ABC-type transporter Mla MlaB component